MESPGTRGKVPGFPVLSSGRIRKPSLTDRSFSSPCARADIASEPASARLRRVRLFQGIEDRLPANPVVVGYGPQNSIQRSHSHSLVCGNGDTVGTWFLSLQDNVAANLVKLGVPPMTAEGGYKFVPAQVTRNFHPRASISSRMR